MLARITGVLVIVALMAVGCLVVDEIQFGDKVNHPPQLLTVEPPNETIYIVDEERPDFLLTLWDPDEEDIATYEARIFLFPNPYVGNDIEQLTCEVTGSTQPEDSPEEYEGGALVTVTCELNLENFLPGLVEDQIMSAKILVADRPFSGQVLPEGAGSVEVVWTLELLVDL